MVGFSQSPMTGNLVATVWRAPAHWAVELPSFPGALDSRANDIDDCGRIIGVVEMGGGAAAALWQGGHVHTVQLIPR